MQRVALLQTHCRRLLQGQQHLQSLSASPHSLLPPSRRSQATQRTARGTACQCAPAGARQSWSTSGGREWPPAWGTDQQRSPCVGQHHSMQRKEAQQQVRTAAVCPLMCHGCVPRNPAGRVGSRAAAPGEAPSVGDHNQSWHNQTDLVLLHFKRKKPIKSHRMMASSSSGVQGPL